MNDALGHFGDVVLVGDDDDRDALPVDVEQDIHHLLRGLGIEGPGGLIGEDHLGLGDEGAGNGHALFLATGELIGHMIGPVAQAYPVEVLQGEAVALAAAHTLVVEREGHILHRIFEGDEVE